MLISTLGSFIGYAALLPVVPLWAVSGGAGEFGAGATTGVFMATTVATQFVVPALARRFGYRNALLLGTLLLGAPTAVFPFTADAVPVLIVSALRGIGFGLLTVCGSALIAVFCRPEQLGRASGMYGVAVGLPALFVVPAATWLVTNVGFTAVFAASTALPLLAAIPIAMLPSAGVRDPARPTGGLRDGLGAVAAPWALMICAASGSGAALTFLPLATAGTSASVALFALTAMTVLGRFAAGRIGDVVGRPGRQLPVAIGLTALGLAGIAVGVSEGIGAASIAVAIVGAALLGAGFGVVQNDSLLLMFARVGTAGAGFASAAWNIGYDAGTGVGAVLLGAIVSGSSYPVGFGVIGVAAALLLPAAVHSARTGARGWAANLPEPDTRGPGT